MDAAEKSARQYKIGESKQRIQLRSVLGQAPIPIFAMMEQAFDDMVIKHRRLSSIRIN